jgi:hypothetical protein
LLISVIVDSTISWLGTLASSLSFVAGGGCEMFVMSSSAARLGDGSISAESSDSFSDDATAVVFDKKLGLSKIDC